MTRAALCDIHVTFITWAGCKNILKYSKIIKKNCKKLEIDRIKNIYRIEKFQIEEFSFKMRLP